MSEMDPTEIRRRLFEAIEHERIGMLGVVQGPHDHFQPMTSYWEEETGKLWFYSYNDSDLAKKVATGRPAMFTFIDKKQEIWACVGGTLKQNHDDARIQKFWNPIVAAWYTQGEDDPRLTLLELDASDAEVWINRKGPVSLGLDILKSNLSRTIPDPGDHATLAL